MVSFLVSFFWVVGRGCAVLLEVVSSLGVVVTQAIIISVLGCGLGLVRGGREGGPPSLPTQLPSVTRTQGGTLIAIPGVILLVLPLWLSLGAGK